MHVKEMSRVLGLLLHLWCQEIFKKIGDSCGGFIVMDFGIACLSHL